MFLLIVFGSIFCDFGVKNFLAAGGSTVELVDEDLVCWNYKRNSDNFLVFVEMITDFTELSMTLITKEKSIFMDTVVYQDSDLFFYYDEIKENVAKTLKLTPKDFQHSSMDDFQMSKEDDSISLDSTKIFKLPMFVDIMNILKPDGSNHEMCFYTNLTFRYDNLKVEKKSIQLFNEELIISESTKLEGNIIAYESTIIVNCSRFELTGNIVLFGESSKMTMYNGAWIWHEDYNHEHNLIATNNSKIEWRDGVFFTYYPYAIVILNSEASLENVNFTVGMFTCSLVESGKLFLNKVKQFGEILVPADTTLEVENSEQVLIWLRFNESLKDSFSIPSENEDFDSKKVKGMEDHNILVEKSEGVAYGIILDSAGEVSIHDSIALAVAMTLEAGVSIIRDIKDGEKYEDSFVHGSIENQGIHLRNSTVGAFNFYAMLIDPSESSKLVIENSVYGESIVYGISEIIVNQSTCDGKGGYFGSNDKSTAYIYDSKITTKVICKDSSKMYFYDSTVIGDVFVENGMIIFDKNCVVKGNLFWNGNGSIIFEK